MENETMNHSFNKSEAAALYAMLRQEPILNRGLSIFYQQLERYIFSQLTIEELENLESLVQRNLL